MLERAVLRAGLEALRARGIFAYRANSGAMKAPSGRFVRFGGVSGLSDVVGILPGGRALYAEAKRQGVGPTAEQAEFLHRVNQAGGLGIVFHDPDELLGQIDRGRPDP